MNIGIDMMGGDFAPLEAVKGLQLHMSTSISPAVLFCIGDEDQINPLLEQTGLSSPEVVTVHAPQVIQMHEHPTKALKEKQQSSIAIGFQMLASGKLDAFISAGNTGAMLVGAVYSLKPLEGIIRPTISTVIPKLNGTTGLLLDVGMNADCKPEQLNQFATLGTVYAKTILAIDNPRVGLLNVGHEEGKGNLLAQATYPLLQKNDSINFIGNIEGRDLFLDLADVILCDGFTGNIVLKMAESIFDVAKARSIDKDDYLGRFNYEHIGGTPVLGVAKPVIIGHGISNATAFANMIALAEKMVSADICGALAASVR